MCVCSDPEEHSHWIIPIVLNWTEKPAREVVLKASSVSRIGIEGGIGGFVSPVVQETCNGRLDPGNIIAAGVVRPVKQLGGCIERC